MASVFKSPNGKTRKKIIISLAAILGVIILFAVTMVVFGADDTNSPFNGVANSVQAFFSDVGTSIGNFFTGLTSQEDIVAENDKLKMQLAEYELLKQQYEAIKIENDYLEELLGYAEENPELECISAKVIAKNPDNWYDVLTINRGTRHGVYKDMCVVSVDGLVGIVIKSDNDWAQVVTIADSRCSVPIVVERSSDNGISRGISDISMYAGKTEVSKLPYEADVLPGDVVVSSGIGGVFPKGIKLGTVAEVTKQQDELQKTAIVEPAVELEKLTYVLIVKNFAGLEVVTNESIIEVN